MAKQEAIGALWTKQGAKGEFMSGEVTIGGVKHEVTIFRNDFKKPGERTPDWRIYPRQAPAQQQTQDDDIPFG